MMPALWKTVWQFLINIHLPDDSAIPPKGIIQEKQKIYMQIFIEALFILAKRWK